MISYKIFDENKYKIITEHQENKKELVENIMQLTTDQTEKELISSLFDPEQSHTQWDLDKLILYIDIITKIQYFDDCIKVLDDVRHILDDKAQINTLMRIISNKPHKIIVNTDSPKIISKNCPHCGIKTSGTNIVDYQICGYSVKGFDWKGCGKDFCMNCGKKLCKSWNNDYLFNKLNRCHDAKCCKNYALKNNFKYPDDFCMCKTDIVKR